MTSSLSLCRAALPIMARMARDVAVLVDGLEQHERTLQGKALAAWQAAHGDTIGDTLTVHMQAMQASLARTIRRLEAIHGR